MNSSIGTWRIDGKYILCSRLVLWILLSKVFKRNREWEIVVINESGIESIKPFQKINPRPCIFEYIYFSRPDSYLGGLSIYECRKAFGKQLAIEFPTDVDYVIPVPDSGVPSLLVMQNTPKYHLS